MTDTTKNATVTESNETETMNVKDLAAMIAAKAEAQSAAPVVVAVVPEEKQEVAATVVAAPVTETKNEKETNMDALAEMAAKVAAAEKAAKAAAAELEALKAAKVAAPEVVKVEVPAPAAPVASTPDAAPAPVTEDKAAAEALAEAESKAEIMAEAKAAKIEKKVEAKADAKVAKKAAKAEAKAAKKAAAAEKAKAKAAEKAAKKAEKAEKEAKKPTTGQSGEKIKDLGTVENPLNAKEGVVLLAFGTSGHRTVHTIEGIAATCWPTKKAVQANSWVRNSLRRLVRGGLVEKEDRGQYKQSEEGRSIAKRLAELKK